MKLSENKPPREYNVGTNKQITIKDCGFLELKPDEQVTLITENKCEYDVARKDWGFYATPSINGRLKDFKLKTALVKNSFNKYYILLVEEGKESSFNDYLNEESLQVVIWLSDEQALARITKF